VIAVTGQASRKKSKHMKKAMLVGYRNGLMEILLSRKKEYVHSDYPLGNEIYYPAVAPITREDEKGLLEEIRRVTKEIKNNY